MRAHYSNRKIWIAKLLAFAGVVCIAISAKAQSFRTVTFSGNSSDFNAAEKISASANNTDYYITFDASNLYIGAFRTFGTFGGTDNLTVYLDTDPDATPTSGTGTTAGQSFNSVSGTLPFTANYNAHVEQSYQEMRSFGSSWASTISGYSVWTSTTAREIKIPFTSIGSPDAVYATLWMGYGGGIYSNAPGTDLGSGANPTVTGYFGGFGVSSASCIPVNITNTPITASITNGVPVSGALYGKVTVSAGTITATNNFNVAPGGSILVSAGTLDISGRTILMGGSSGGNGFGTTINYTGGTLTTSAATSLTFNGEGFHTGNAWTYSGTMLIKKSFTPLPSGGTTFASGASLDIRAGGFVSTNAPTYASGSTLMYNSGNTYTAGTEWTANAGSGTGVPSNVTIGNNVASSVCSFGTSSSYRQATGNVTVTSGAGLTLSSVSGGDLRIGGNFSNNGTFTHNTREIEFNGTSAQAISGTLNNGTAATNILTYLTISNTTAIVSLNSSANIGNSFTINANARLDVTSGNTLTLNSGITSSVAGFLRNSSGTITPTGTLTIANGGTYEHNYTTTQGVIPTCSWSSGSTCKIIGYTTYGGGLTSSGGYGQTFQNFEWACSALTASTNWQMNTAGAAPTILGDFTISNTNSAANGLRLSSSGTYTLNISGNFVINSTNGNAKLDLTNGGTGTINIGGNLSILQPVNSATLQLSSGTATINFNKSSGTQTFSNNGTISGAITFNAGTGTSTNTVQLTSNVALGSSSFNALNAASVDFQSFVLSGSGIFTAATGATLVTSNSAGFSTSGATGSIQTSTRTFTNAGVNYTYNSGASNTGNAIGAASNIKNLTISNGSGVTLTTATTIAATGTLTFTNGVLDLGSNDLTLTSGASISGAAAGKYVKTSGTGQLKRTALSSAFTFEVGNAAYNPITLTNSGTSDTYGILVKDGTVPNALDNTKTVNRYWAITEGTSGGGNLAVTVQFNSSDGAGAGYNTSTNPQYIGIYPNALPWIQQSSGIAAGGTDPFTVSASGFTNSLPASGSTYYFAVGLSGAFITPSVTYTWTGTTSSDWNTATNWSPNGIPGAGDNVIINTGANPLTLTTSKSITDLTFNGNFSVTSSGALTTTGNITYTSGSGTWNCGSTFTISSTSNQPVPPFAYGNLVLTGGNRSLPNGSTVSVCGNYTPSAGTTTVIGNMFAFNGSAAQSILTNAATFNTVNITNTTAAVSAAINVTTANLNVNANASYNQTAASFSVTGNTTNSGSITVNNGSTAGLGTVTNNSNGTITHNGTGSITASSVSNSGIVTFSNTGSITVSSFTNNSGANLSWTAAGTLNIAATGTLTNDGTFTRGTGTVNFVGAGTVNGSSAITFNNININIGAVTLATGTRVDGTLAINGGNIGNTGASPTYTSNSTLHYPNGYTRYLEWSAVGTGTIGVTPGYPNHVIIGTGSNTVTLNLLNADAGTARSLEGNLTVNSGATFNTGAINAVVTVGGNMTLNSTGAVVMGSTNKELVVKGTVTNAGSLTLSSSSGGDLYVGGDFTNNGTFTHNNRAVFFNGQGPQVISGSFNGSGTTNRFPYLFIQNTAAYPSGVSGASSISAGTSGQTSFLVNANSLYNQTAGTLTVVSGAIANVNGYLRNSDATITATGTLTFTNGSFYEHNHTNTQGVIPTATWNTGSTCSIIGYTSSTQGPTSGLGQSFHHVLWSCTSQAGTVQLSGGLTTVLGNLTISSTGSGKLRLTTASGSTPLTLNVAGNLSVAGGSLSVIGGGTGGTNSSTVNVGGAFNLSAGTLDFNEGASSTAATINLTGNFLQSGGSILRSLGTTATFNFISPASQTVNQSAGTIGGTGFTGAISWNVGTGTSSTALQLLSNLNTGSASPVAFNILNNASVDFQTYQLQGSLAFNANSGSSILTSNTDAAGALTISSDNGSVRSTGTRTYSAGVNYTFNGAAAQNTGDAVGQAANIGNLTIVNGNNVSLGASATVAGTVILTNGRLALGTYNLTLPASGAVTGLSATRFIETNSTGSLVIPIPIISSGSSNFVFPVGNGTNYSPASFNFSNNTVATNLQVRSAVPRNTNDISATDYINNRWWNTNLSNATGSYTYTASYTYISGDLVGTAANVKLNRWDGTAWTSDPNSAVNTGTLTLNSGTLTEIDGPLNATAQWVGRAATVPVTYTWNNITGPWTTNTNWTPNGVPGSGDNVIFTGNVTSTVSSIPANITLRSMTFSAGVNVSFSAASGTTNTINIGGGTAPQFNMAAGTTLQLTGGNSLSAIILNMVSGYTSQVSGTIIAGTGVHKFTASSASSIAFKTGSIFRTISGFNGNPFGSTGTANTAVFESGSVYDYNDGANPFGLASPASKIVFNSGSLYRHNNSTNLPVSAGRTYANFEWNNSLTPTPIDNLNASSAAMVMDNLAVTQGTMKLYLAGTPGHTIKGNITVAAGATLDISPASSGTINLSGTALQTISGSGTITTGTHSILNITNSTGVSLQKDISCAGTLVVASAALLNITGENKITGSGIFTLNSGGTLGIGSAQGISTAGTATGNVQTSTRNFSSGGNYTYKAAYSQSTGNGLPNTVTGIITIANTGTGGNNVVSLTTNNTTGATLNLVSGLFQPGSGQQFNISSGGAVNASGGDFVSGTGGGTLNFQNSGSFSGTCSPYNVYLSSTSGNTGVNFGPGTVTIQNGGSLRINSGGFVNTNAPYYDFGSTLVYNTGGNFSAASEWYANTTSGRGVPYNVQIGLNGVNNSVLNFGTNALYRYCTNNLLIGNGTGGTGYGLTLSTNASGDVKLEGNWQRYANGSFTPNNRAVYFTGAGNTQTITATSGSEVFSYLVVDKPGGNLQLSSGTDITINGSLGGNVLQLTQGDIDLNGQTCNLGGTGGFLNVAGAERKIISATTANFNVIGSKEFTSTSGGTLLFNDQVYVNIGAGVNFGAGVTTINARLQLNAGGFADINAPLYGPNGILIYNTGGTYSRRVEWSGSEGNAGYPNDVVVQNNTTLIAAGTVMSGTGEFVNRVFGARRDVTIAAGSSIEMNGSGLDMAVPLQVGRDLTINGNLVGSNAIGGDIYLGRNWTRAIGGAYTHNGRTLRLDGSSNTTISAPAAGETFGYLRVYKTAASNTVTCAAPVAVANDLELNTGILISTATNLLTVNNTAAAAIIGGSANSYVSGPLKRFTSTSAAGDYFFPLGDFASSRYKPLTLTTINNLSTASSFTGTYNFSGPPSAGSDAFLTSLAGIQTNEFWQLDRLPTSGGTTGKLTIPYLQPTAWRDAAGLSLSPCANCNVAVVKRSSSTGSGTWDFTSLPSNFDVYAPTPEARYYTQSGDIVTREVTSFSPFAFGFAANTILPVKLLYFTGSVNAGNAVLNWKADHLQDLKGFELEHSTDGLHFALLLQQKASSLQMYSYTHFGLSPAMHYYRLKVLDKNGSSFYSRVVALQVSQLKTQIMGLNQNPVYSELTPIIYSAGKQAAKAVITDAAGRIISEHAGLLQAGKNSWAITLQQTLAAGTYYILIATKDGTRSTLPFVKAGN